MPSEFELWTYSICNVTDEPDLSWWEGNQLVYHTVQLHIDAYNRKDKTDEKAYMTGPAKIGHICTQNLALLLNFNSQYLMKYKSYDNETLKAYLQMNKKAETVYRTWIS